MVTMLSHDSFDQVVIMMSAYRYCCEDQVIGRECGASGVVTGRECGAGAVVLYNLISQPAAYELLPL